MGEQTNGSTPPKRKFFPICENCGIAYDGDLVNGLCPNCNKEMSVMKKVEAFNKAIKFKLEAEAKDYEWKDIDDEEFRVYVFPGGCRVIINEPLKLYVTDNGHRIFDAEGFSHYVPNRWIHLFWKAKEGKANFRF